MIPAITFNHTGDILIVDDVPENLQLLFEILSEEGHEVRRVLNGNQAIQAIQVDPPDLILLDIKMPVMDGYEVCRQLKADPKTANIPIIFLSALNDVLDKVKAFAVGGVDYINKPFDVYEVLVRVDSQLKLLQATKQLEQKNIELESLNQDLEAFSYMLSHDLRRPLTSLMGFCELLITDEETPKAEYQETLGIILNAGREMNEMISDLMHLAKIKQEQLNLESINLSLMAGEIMQRLQKAEPERALEMQIDAEMIVIGDRPLLKAALENMLGNAWKYTAKKEAAIIYFSRSAEGIFSIKDNGVGFSMEQKQDVFTPFKRLHRNSDFVGTGIGLTIVKQIIQSHHGKIWCEAEIDKGACFYFTIDSK